MKRTPALQPLSRQHHQGLFAAQRLKRASDEDRSDVQAHFLSFWKDDGRRHFRLEEELLLPAYARHAPADNPEVVRVLTEHVRIRAFATQLAEGPVPPARLHELGQLLGGHIRFEERTLFALIEAALTPAQLSQLAAAVAEAEAADPAAD